MPLDVSPLLQAEPVDQTEAFTSSDEIAQRYLSSIINKTSTSPSLPFTQSPLTLTSPHNRRLPLWYWLRHRCLPRHRLPKTPHPRRPLPLQNHLHHCLHLHHPPHRLTHPPYPRSLLPLPNYHHRSLPLLSTLHRHHHQ